MSKICHVWRDAAGTMFDTWDDIFGAELARQLSCKLPPKCLSGRWDSIYKCENFVMRSGGFAVRVDGKQAGVLVRQLPVVIFEALTNKQSNKRKVGLLALQDDKDLLVTVEDPSNETTADYSKRLGRWRRDTVDTLADEDFWQVTAIVSMSHDPLQHHMGFLSKHISPEELDKHGGHVAQLASHKAQQILAECMSCFVNPEWAEGLSSQLLVLAVELHCHHAAAYHRRVVTFLQRCSLHNITNDRASNLVVSN